MLAEAWLIKATTEYLRRSLAAPNSSARAALRFRRAHERREAREGQAVVPIIEQRRVDARARQQRLRVATLGTREIEQRLQIAGGDGCFSHVRACYVGSCF